MAGTWEQRNEPVCTRCVSIWFSLAGQLTDQRLAVFTARASFSWPHHLATPPLICAGQLTDQPLAEFSAMLHGPPTSHFLFAKYMLPALKQSPASSFLFVSEGAGRTAAPCAAAAAAAVLQTLLAWCDGKHGEHTWMCSVPN